MRTPRPLRLPRRLAQRLATTAHHHPRPIPTRLLAEFGNAIPRDNYEGIAVTTDDDGQFVWLISDDNFMAIQRTLLLKLRWDRREKARE